MKIEQKWAKKQKMCKCIGPPTLLSRLSWVLCKTIEEDAKIDTINLTSFVARHINVSDFIVPIYLKLCLSIANKIKNTSKSPITGYKNPFKIVSSI